MYSNLLPLAVLIGAGAGVAIGIYSPPLTGLIAPLGTIYVRLMEVVVLPYLVSTLVLGLGRLTPQIAIRLFEKSWRIYILLWTTVFAALLLAASTAPLIRARTIVDFGGTDPADTGSGPSLIDLLVPDNFFEALNQNYIPSIVLMAVIFGIAVQRIENRGGMLDALGVIQSACVKVWSWIVLFAPIGVLGLVAGSIDSMSTREFAAMSIYMSVVVLSTLILALWILPMLMTVFVPLRYLEIVSALKSAYLIGIVTSLSVAALPMVQRAAEQFADRFDRDDPERQAERKEIIQTTLSVSYPLAQVGNFVILVFVFYALFYYSVPIETRQMIELPFITLLSGIGSPTSSIGAVSFLTNWLGLPAEATNLYVETMAVTRYGQVLASISGFAFITVVVTFAFYGRLRFSPRALAVTVAGTAVLLAAVWSVGRLSGTHVQLRSEDSYLAMELPADIQRISDANLLASLKQAPAGEEGAPAKEPASGRPSVMESSAIERIQSSGVLRVGINPNVMPFAYTNNAGRLVGFDVELIYRFARDLNVDIVFVPYAWQSLARDLVENRFDLAISGLYITEQRERMLTVSDPYFESKMALMVRTDRLDDFTSRERIDRIEGLTIGVFDDPVLVPLARRSFPTAEIKVVPSYDKLVLGSGLDGGIDAAIWTQAQASAWAISRQDHSAVVPNNMAYGFLFGYLMPPDSTGLANYLDYWMRLERANGLLDDMTKRWIDPAFDGGG